MVRAVWALVVVCLTAAGPRPVQASPRAAQTIVVTHHDAVIVASRHAGTTASAGLRRAHRLDAGPAIVPATFALTSPPRVVIEEATTPHAPRLRARSIACSARGPPLA